MGDIKTRADGLRIYLSGASSDGAAQADSSQSLGRFRSSSEAEFLAMFVAVTIPGLQLDFAAGENGAGTGTIEAVDDDTVRWAAPGCDFGAGVAISNGQTKVLESGLVLGSLDPSDLPGRYVRVTRTSASALSGSMAVELGDVFQNSVGMDPVTSAQAAAGLEQYRLIVVRNENVLGVIAYELEGYLEGIEGATVVDGADGAHAGNLGASGAGTITLGGGQPGTFASWPQQGWVLIVSADGSARELAYYSSRSGTALTVPTAGRALGGTSARAGAGTDVLAPWPGLTMAFEDPDAQPSGEFSGWSGTDFEAPAGLTWRVPREAGEELLTRGSLKNGELLGVWLRWSVPAGAVATAAPALRRAKIGWEAVG